MNHQDRGIHNYRNGNFQAALKDLNKAIQNNHLNANAHLYRGHCLLTLDKYPEAVEAYTAALQLQPKNTYALANRAKAYHHTEHYKKALYDFNQALRLQPEDVIMHYHRGLTYKAVKNYRNAQTDFIKAMKLHPQHPLYLFNMVLCYWQRGYKDKAMGYFRKGARYINWKEQQELVSKFNLGKDVAKLIKEEVREFLEVVEEVEELQGRARRRGKIDLVLRLEEIVEECHERMIKYTAQLQHETSITEQMLVKAKQHKKQISDELCLLSTELSKVMLRKKTSSYEEYAFRKPNPQEAKTEEEARMVARRVFLDKKVLRQIQYLDRRLHEYYQYFYAELVEHFLAYQFTAQPQNQKNGVRKITCIRSVDELVQKMTESQIVLQTITILADLMTAPFQVADIYFSINIAELSKNITEKNKIFRYRNEEQTCIFLAHAMQKLISNQTYNRRLLMVLDYKDSTIVKAQVQKIGQPTQNLGSVTLFHSFLTLFTSLQLTLITTSLYTLDHQQFQQLVRDKEQIYQLVLGSVFPKLKEQEGIKTSTEDSKKDRREGREGREGRSKGKRSVGCGGDSCMIY